MSASGPFRYPFICILWCGGQLPRHTPQPGRGIVKKASKRLAISVYRLRPGEIPVPRASAPAKRLVDARLADWRPARALRLKSAAGRRRQCLPRRILPNTAHTPFVKHKEIAWIQPSIAFHHQIIAAVSGGCAGARFHPQHEAQIIVKYADTDIDARRPIAISAIEQTAKKPAIIARRQGIIHCAAVFHRIKAGDQLKRMLSERPQRAVKLMGTARRRSGNHAQQVCLHPAFVQLLQSLDGASPRTLSVRVQPKPVMQTACAIDRQTDQKAMFTKKRAPLPVQTHTVCLDGPAQPHTGRAAVLCILYKCAQPIQAHKGRFASLKQILHSPSGLHSLKACVNQAACRLLRHKSHAFDLTPVGHIIVKAIAAAEIAKAGGRLDQKCNRIHRVFFPLPCALAAPSLFYRFLRSDASQEATAAPRVYFHCFVLR